MLQGDFPYFSERNKKTQTFTNLAILTKGPMELLMQETHLVPKATTPLWEGRGRESLSLIWIWR